VLGINSLCKYPFVFMGENKETKLSLMWRCSSLQQRTTGRSREALLLVKSLPFCQTNPALTLTQSFCTTLLSAKCSSLPNELLISLIVLLFVRPQEPQKLWDLLLVVLITGNGG
jgi:hypothetical protein